MNRNLATSSPRRRIGLVLTSAVVGCALLVGADGALAAPADGGVLKANPKRVNFGTKQVGTFTVKGSTITNTGSTELLVQTVADRMPDQFSWGLFPGQTCPIFEPAPLGPGESCGIAVGFRPEAFWAGREDLAVLGLSVFDPATGVPIDSVLVEFRGVTKL